MTPSFKQGLLRVARFIDSRTHRLDSYKYRLGLYKKVLTLLSPRETEIQPIQILSQCQTAFISNKIKSLERQNFSIIHLYVLCVESIGDVIACEPISRYLKKAFPFSTIHWVVLAPFSEIVRYNPFVDVIHPVASLGEGYSFCKSIENHENVLVNCHFNGWRCMRTGIVISNPVNPLVNIDTFLAIGNILQTYSLAAGLPPLDDAPVFHLRNDLAIPSSLLDSKYVVVHCHSTGLGKNWDNGKWNNLVKWLLAFGIKVIEIGTERIIRQAHQNLIDYSGEKSFQELASIIQHAALFIGVDSCFAHVANAFRVKSIILMGRFRNFSIYTPFSGDFSRSSQFIILRAPDANATSEIPLELVIETSQSFLMK